MSITIKEAAHNYAVNRYGEPKDWTPRPTTTEHMFNLDIELAYLAGYQSRDTEVSSLQGDIKELVEALRIGEALIAAFDIRFPTTKRLLVGYNNSDAIQIVKDTYLKFSQKQTTNL